MELTRRETNYRAPRRCHFQVVAGVVRQNPVDLLFYLAGI